jgi:hypothetical protein
MYPSASHTERIALKDDVLPLRFPVKSATGEEMTSVRIKEGQLIYVPIIAINRNATVSNFVTPCYALTDPAVCRSGDQTPNDSHLSDGSTPPNSLQRTLSHKDGVGYSVSSKAPESVLVIVLVRSQFLLRRVRNF